MSGRNRFVKVYDDPARHQTNESKTLLVAWPGVWHVVAKISEDERKHSTAHTLCGQEVGPCYIMRTFFAWSNYNKRPLWRNLRLYVEPQARVCRYCLRPNLKR